MRRWAPAVLMLSGMAAGLAPTQAAHSNAAGMRVIRDEYGVPQIYFEDLGALFFGFGHAVAQDRLFQLEMTRRTAWGTVAEVLRPEYVKTDSDQRRTGYSRAQVREQIAGLALEYGRC